MSTKHLSGKRKAVVVLLVLSVAALAVGAIVYKNRQSRRKADSYGGEFYRDGDGRDGKVMKLLIGTRKMQDTLGEDNIYPDYYKQVKMAVMNDSDQGEAFRSTERNMLENYALYRTAEKRGFAVSEKELKRHVDKVLKGMEKSGDYKKLDAMYRGQGTTFKKEYIANRRWNIYDATFKKWDDSIIAGNPGRIKGDDAGGDIAKGREKLVAAYHNTEEGKALRKALRDCRIALKKYGSNARAVKRHYGSSLDFALKLKTVKGNAE